MGNKIIKSVDRSLQILELFNLDKTEWGITEISEELNFYKSTVHNILSTLEERGFVKKNPQTEKYKLGVKLFEMGSVVLKDMNLRQIAAPYIDKLSNKFNETVHLGVLDDGKVLSIEQEESSKSLRSSVIIGKKVSLHCTSVGKAIMAYLPEEHVDKIIAENGLKAYTDNTITDENLLKQELTKIKKQGYAVDNMEHEEGVRCIAAPIYNYTGEVFASLSVSGPLFRIKDNYISEIASEVKKCCNLISKEMGYLQENILS